MWLAGHGLIQLSRDFVVELAGSCSFCGKSGHEWFALAGVPGRPARICQECVALCMDILGEEAEREAHVAAKEARARAQAARQAAIDAVVSGADPLAAAALAPGRRSARTRSLEQGIEARVRREVASGSALPRRHNPSGLCCSFCDRSQREVSKIIAGPNVYICDSCTGGASALIGRLEVA